MTGFTKSWRHQLSRWGAALSVFSLLGFVALLARAQIPGSPIPWTPCASYSLTYDANGASSGSVTTGIKYYRCRTSIAVAANAGSLTKTGYSFAGWNTAADGSGTTYPAVSGTFTMGTANVTLYARWVAPLNCSGLAGGSWVSVPGDGVYGTSDFCVQKYVPTNVSNVPTSRATSSSDTPWVSINQTDSKTRCSALGTGYSLISNPQWMTIAANLANVGSNWSGGSVGSGELARGHSDSSPNSACAADADDSKGWVDGTGDCTGKVQGSFQFRERRTRTLSNGSVIWDFGGNVWQWVDAYNPNNKPQSINNWVQYNLLGNGTTDWPRSAFVPLNSAQSWWTDSWSSTQAIGQIYPGTNGSGGALLRGGSWYYAVDASAGVFAASLSADPSYTAATLAFRCVYAPTTTYTVTYDANSATSGTTPTPSGHGAGQTVTAAANSGTLARTGYAFAGWNTAADGSGTNYTAGSGTFTMGSANVTLYARWTSCGESAANNCYTGTNAATLQAAGSAITPLGKSLTWNTGESVWEESGAGTRVLSADGRDSWAYQLNGDGRSYSSSFLAKTNVAGRVCPTNVFVPGNLVATGKCIYFDGGSASSQRLDAPNNDSTTVQTAGSYRLGAWNTDIGGNGTSASWYEGNIQTCANKGMRLPTLYETNASDPGGTTKPTDAAPTGWGSGVAAISGTSWTASAVTDSNTRYRTWNTSGAPSTTLVGGTNFVRCVAPSEVLYTITYDANGATAGTAPTDSNLYNTGGTVTAVNNTGNLAKTGFSFAGWDTAADGSGTDYAAGSALTMGSANITLYARWVVPATCGSSAADNCYTGTNAATAKATGYASTPLGKSLIWNASESVWEENSGSRVLAADGSDTWAYQLSINGRSYSANFLDKANVAGRACPTNVFVPGNLVATGKCLYYDGGNTGQGLEAAGTSQADLNTMGLERWDFTSTGNGASASWYEGNIKTCAAKGMRLPVIYETTAADPGGSNKPTDASPAPSWSTSTTGIPNTPGSYMWTATAAAGAPSREFWVWMGTTGSNDGSSTTNTLRCVVPSEALYTVSYDANGAIGGAAPAAGTYMSGAIVTAASNSGTLARTGYVFSGWNTAADGSGTNYSAGSSTFTMGSANVTLYARWTSCGESVANNCYNGINAATLQTAGSVTTPSGKNLSYVFANGSSGFKVWRETGGTRILSANGLDQWSKALNPNGIGQSATDFTDPGIATTASRLEGRVCPSNVYIDASNKFTTSNCLYYTPSYPAQTLNANGSDGINGMMGWSTPKWFVGNIQTCSAKGMRLPTLYETSVVQPSGPMPTPDGMPTAWGGANGVPSTAWTWTASSYNNVGANYLVWSGSSDSINNYYYASAVRCVVP